MNLPSVNISYDNGAIAQAVASNDGLLCIAVVGHGNDSLKDGSLTRLTSPKDLTRYNVSIGDNRHIIETIRDFYKEVPEGTPVYLVVYPNTLAMGDVLEYYRPYLAKVVVEAKGEIRGIVVIKQYVKGDEANIEPSGMHAEVSQAISMAHRLGDWAEYAHHAPLFVLLHNYLFTFKGERVNIPLSGWMSSRVGVVTGYRTFAEVPAIGLVAGRIAASPVHRHIGRVRDGSLQTDSITLGDGNDIDEFAQYLTGNGHISFRRFSGKAGYFITDDLLCSNDDYCFLTRRRTIDKAYRIAYNLLVEELNDEIPVNRDGTMIETYATAFEQKVENTIALNMTRNGELSVDPSDPNDQGVKFVVYRTVNVLATNQIKATLRVRPYGYAKYIDVLLGFTVVS